MIAIALASIIAAAAPGPPKPDMTAATRAFHAALDAISRHTAPVSCVPLSLRGIEPIEPIEPCDAEMAGIPHLDLHNLTYFAVSPCSMEAGATHCAVFDFDLGQGGAYRTTLVVASGSATVRTAADVTSVTITQGPRTSD